MKRAGALSLHRYVGLVSAIPVLIIATTGLILGFYGLVREHLDEIHSGASQTTPVDSWVDSARFATHESSVKAIEYPKSPGAVARVRMASDRVVVIDSTDSRVISIVEKKDDWRKTLYHLHRGKVFGVTGQVFTGLIAVAVVFLFLLGWKFRRSARRRHVRIGVFFGAIAAVVASSGAILNFAAPLMARFDPAPRLDADKPSARADLFELERSARSAYPGAAIESLHLSNRPGIPSQFFFKDTSRVYLNAVSGEVVKVAPWDSHWTRALFRLHTGRIFGSFQPLWISFISLSLIALVVTGISLYVRRAVAYF